MAVSKVVYGGETLMDLTSDTVTPETLLEGVTAHDASGAAIVGTLPWSQLVAKVEALQRNLAREKAVYENLEDSSGDLIEDSYGNVIEGKTVFATPGDIPNVSFKDDSGTLIYGNTDNGAVVVIQDVINDITFDDYSGTLIIG